MCRVVRGKVLEILTGIHIFCEAIPQAQAKRSSESADPSTVIFSDFRENPHLGASVGQWNPSQ